MKIFLIGLSGTGKSSIGKQLSSRLKVGFLDTDTVIEKNEQKSISEIFRIHGELYFRGLESNLLSDLPTISEQDCVVSTGGGMPCFDQNMNRMLELGVVIHLTMPLEMLVSRLEKSTNRPLLAENLRESLKNQFNERNPMYSKAHLTIQSINWNAEKMNHLVEQLNQIDTIRPA